MCAMISCPQGGGYVLGDVHYLCYTHQIARFFLCIENNDLYAYFQDSIV
jgi:hypothetical protein